MTRGAQAFGRGEFHLPQPIHRMEHHHLSHQAIVHRSDRPWGAGIPALSQPAPPRPHVAISLPRLKITEALPPAPTGR
jgi:hypothetical protein